MHVCVGVQAREENRTKLNTTEGGTKTRRDGVDKTRERRDVERLEGRNEKVREGDNRDTTDERGRVGYALYSKPWGTCKVLVHLELVRPGVVVGGDVC